MTGEDVLGAVRALGPDIANRAAEVEQARRVPGELVDALVAAGAFRLAVPAELGGVEAHPRQLLEVIEEVARADGSVGWVTMIGAVTGVMAAYLPEAAAKEVYGDPGVITGGVFAPIGSAAAADGGWVATGRWPFASGCEHSHWLLGGCVAGDEVLGLLFPRADVEIIDTWDVSGLRGTGSHDMAVAGAFVPDERALRVLTMEPLRGGPLYRFPFFGLLALGIGAVSLGIARRSIDELVALASGAGRRSAKRSAVQAQVARAEASLRSARALVLAEIDAAWQLAERDGAVPIRSRALLRLALTNAARVGAEVTREMYDAGGGASLYAASPLQRCFRDAHAATQHVMVGAQIYELAGRVLLGVETDTSQL